MMDLVVMDYSVSEVHCYSVDTDVEINENFIRSLGHNPSNSSWMVSRHVEFNFH